MPESFPGEIPDEFRCPISLDVMWDPVTISSGHTFDRRSIEAWLSTTNFTCPVTRSPITADLIPNITLRDIIHRFCGQKATPNSHHTVPDPSLLRALLSRSSPSSGHPIPVRVAALTQLGRIAGDSEDFQSLLSSFPETRSVLTSILFSAESDSGELMAQSLSLLATIRLNEVHPDRVGFLIGLMSKPYPIEVKADAAAVLESVLVGTTSPELRLKIFASDRVFKGVLLVIEEGKLLRRAVKVGLKALLALCLDKHHRGRAVEAGATEAVAELVVNSADLDKGDTERALAVAELLCWTPEGCVAFAANPVMTPALVRTILKVSEKATESAIGTLLQVCWSSETAMKVAVAEGVVTRSLLVVQSGCTVRGKRKAMLLLKLLMDSWPNSSQISDELYCDNVKPY